MGKFAIGLATAVFLTAVGAAATPAQFAKQIEVPGSGHCYPKTKVEELLNKGEFIIELRGKSIDGKLSEVWLNSQSVVLVLEYIEPKNGDAKSISEVCVTSAISDVVYNGTAVEVLNKSLLKTSPKI